MSACAELEGLLAERASGPIAPEDEARVAEHLAACPACLKVFEEYRQVFGFVAMEARPLTPAPVSPRAPSPARRGPEGAPSLAPGTLRAWRQRRQRRVTAIALGAGFGAAAAAAALVLAPAFLSSRAPPPALVAASWEPDVDAALDVGDGAEGTASAVDADDEEVTAADVALAAYDEATSR
jgi:anti-sigma factor RsiW